MVESAFIKEYIYQTQAFHKLVIIYSISYHTGTGTGYCWNNFNNAPEKFAKPATKNRTNLYFHTCILFLQIVVHALLLYFC